MYGQYQQQQAAMGYLMPLAALSQVPRLGSVQQLDFWDASQSLERSSGFCFDHPPATYV
jgi:hypothetical protein